METEAILGLIDDETWPLSGLKPVDLAPVRTIAEMNHSEVVTLFFPNLAH